MSKLFSDDEEGGTTQLTINEHYAKAFEYRKEREELERLKAKYGSDYDPDGSGSDFSTDSESAESEDEHGEELTPAVDAAILRTLARIRKKDPEIYDSQVDIFGAEKEKINTTKPSNGQTKSKSKSKPVTIRQVNMEAMLNPSRSPSPEAENRTLTYAQEQEALRKETIAAFHGAVAKAGDDDFLIPREKTKDEQEREEEEYRAFLEREVGDLRELVSVDGNDDDDESDHEEEQAAEAEAEAEAEGSGKNKKKKKKKKKSKETNGEKPVEKSKGEKDQEFLLNYILNRGWIDRSEGHVPTYNEVTLPTEERRKRKGKAKAEEDPDADPDDEMDTGMLSDTSFESLASHFEASYNHRFEEPGAATIPSFPRTLPALVRREDTTRKDARERRRLRKEAELQKKREEVRRLKALKMREVKRKLELIGRQGGLKKGAGDGEEEDGFVDEALRELDLEGEWDPEKHDRQMAGLFDRGADAFEEEEGGDIDEADAVYGADDGVNFDDDGKPVWVDDVDIGDIPISDDDANVVYGQPEMSKKEKKKKKKKKKEAEEEGAVDIDAMDADIEPQLDDEEWDGTEEMRKRIFNKYMDEIYGLDFNDIVGDLPTRFKYVPVQPQAYALTPAEILMATDQELNEYMSVKKYAPYRQEKGDRHRWNPKSQEKLHQLKSKLGERVGTKFLGSSSGQRRSADDGQAEKAKKRMGKKERMKLKAALGAVDGEAPGGEVQSAPAAGLDDSGATKSKKRKREQDQNNGDGERSGESRDALSIMADAGEGAAKKKRKRRQKRKDGEEEAAQTR